MLCSIQDQKLIQLHHVGHSAELVVLFVKKFLGNIWVLCCWHISFNNNCITHLQVPKAFDEILEVEARTIEEIQVDNNKIHMFWHRDNFVDKSMAYFCTEEQL